jgi:hypothetical protein
VENSSDANNKYNTSITGEGQGVKALKRVSVGEQRGIKCG